MSDSQPQPTPDAPAPRARKHWTRALLPPLIGGGLGYLLARGALGAFGADSPWLRQRLGALEWFDLLLLPVLILFVLAVHEAGHLLGGFSRGMRFLLFVVGPFQWSRTASGIRFNWLFNLGTLGGLAAATPDPAQPLARQLKPLIIGGPLASLLLAGAGVAIAMVVDGRMGAYGLIVGAISAMIFVVTAIPMRAGGYMSDGMQLLELLRGGSSVLDRQLLTTLMAQSMAGLRPRDWNPDDIANALAMKGTEPLRRIAARSFALYHALDRADAEAVREHAAWLQVNVDDYPDGFRQSLHLELCLVAIAQGDTTRARDNWQRSRGGIADASRRALVKAAMATLDGDIALAHKTLAESRSALGRAMDQGVAHLTRDQIAALEVQLHDTPPTRAAA